MLDPIDSNQASAGQRFHAAVAKDAAVGGVFLAKGSNATIVLAPGTAGNRWTLNLIEITVNGKVAGVLGQNPAVVPSSAGDFLSMSKKAVSSRDRIAVAAGENIRFQLVPVPPQSASQQAAVAGNAGSPTAPNSPSPLPASAQALGPQGDAPPAHIGPFGTVFHDLNIEVCLAGCERQGTATTTCTFTILNQGQDRSIGLGPASRFGLVDSKGQVIGYRLDLPSPARLAGQEEADLSTAPTPISMHTGKKCKCTGFMLLYCRPLRSGHRRERCEDRRLHCAMNKCSPFAPWTIDIRLSNGFDCQKQHGAG